MEIVRVNKLATITLTHAAVIRESICAARDGLVCTVCVIRFTYEGRKLDQIEPGGNYFFDVETGEVVELVF